MNGFKWFAALAATCALAIGVAACGGSDDEANGSGGDLSGSIRVDGSSTVAPLTEAVAEEFEAANPGVKVTVGTSGTGGGFEKFCAGETDISAASRAIEPEEVAACKQSGIVNEEVRVATDALTVVVNPENPVDCLTVEQLGAIWGPDSDLSSWDEIPGMAEDFDEELSLFGPGTDSGTFEFFTEEVNGEEAAQREDYQPSENDNVLVQGVEGSEGGMAYFGYSYYDQTKSTLNL
ncbi:MAG TPA: phosphate ABC transporter substrate-binding protein PstS family protein, partial [Solirubrobacterales bacterium]|nr:phosphate ABC transporter substrate-binding protein PstS family protein [Solirubrobacterales bacterium]